MRKSGPQRRLARPQPARLPHVPLGVARLALRLFRQCQVAFADCLDWRRWTNCCTGARNIWRSGQLSDQLQVLDICTSHSTRWIAFTSPLDKHMRPRLFANHLAPELRYRCFLSQFERAAVVWERWHCCPRRSLHWLLGYRVLLVTHTTRTEQPVLRCRLHHP